MDSVNIKAAILNSDWYAFAVVHLQAQTSTIINLMVSYGPAIQYQKGWSQGTYNHR